MSEIKFPHIQSAHCENGVVSNMLRFHGHDFSEPMVFGIGAGIFFSHIPFVKVSGLPGTSYRIWPGQIFKRFAKRTGIEVKSHTYSNTSKAMDALDQMLENGIPVGLLTSVFYLTYLPDAFRFHFNAHNIVVYGKSGNEYLVSDPVMDTVSRIHRDDLIRARFAKGIPEPNGKMYYPVGFPKQYDLNYAVWRGVRQAGYGMSQIPLPWFGKKGIRLMADKVQSYPDKLSARDAIRYLGNIVRMQEEIGTGGAGFRFVYAAFLKEAGDKLNNDELREFSNEMTVIGDKWRDFAYYAGRTCKNRKNDTNTYHELADRLRECANDEEVFFTKLYQVAGKKLKS
ncbi:MAG: BtrH N-terminal domain-containing protein [Chitinophagales bacterium]